MNSNSGSLSGRSLRDPRPGASRGFTLLELMIVVVIIAILAAVALSAYGYATRKTRRSAAQGCLVEQSQFMERYFSTSPTLTYVGGAPPGCSTDVTSFYNIPVPAATATSYTITATATGDQLKDSSCTPMTVNKAGTKTPTTGCW